VSSREKKSYQGFPYLIPPDVIDKMNMKGCLLEKKKLPTVSLKTREQNTLSRNAKETII